ncbi:MAG TPA: hypothetical protein VE178_16515, partial [Silvibacterium sp.]|nr:hypothetical protein [Silvibacterium sp.]
MKMMKAIFLAVLLAPGVLLAQNPTQSVDITPLKNQLAAQQKLLDQQAQQIKALQSALAEQKKTLDSLSQGGAPAAALQESVTELKQQVSTVAAQEGQVSNPPLSPAAQQEEEELQRGPEIADVLPDTPAIPVGPAKLRIIGYPALTGVFRSNNSGGNVGTSFGSIPYTNTAPGNASEFRLSAQSTRLALRVDAPLQNNQTVAGYFEMDFGGSPNAGNIAVTSTSYTFRIRQAWFEYAKDKFSFDAGQLFTLMTPLKKGITPWPGDVATTQVVDTNYVAGTVVGRYPQFRMVYRASKDVNLGFSIENPE